MRLFRHPPRTRGWRAPARSVQDHRFAEPARAHSLPALGLKLRTPATLEGRAAQTAWIARSATIVTSKSTPAHPGFAVLRSAAPPIAPTASPKTPTAVTPANVRRRPTRAARGQPARRAPAVRTEKSAAFRKRMAAPRKGAASLLRAWSAWPTCPDARATDPRSASRAPVCRVGTPRSRCFTRASAPPTREEQTNAGMTFVEPRGRPGSDPHEARERMIQMQVPDWHE